MELESPDGTPIIAASVHTVDGEGDPGQKNAANSCCFWLLLLMPTAAACAAARRRRPAFPFSLSDFGITNSCLRVKVALRRGQGKLAGSDLGREQSRMTRKSRKRLHPLRPELLLHRMLLNTSSR